MKAITLSVLVAALETGKTLEDVVRYALSDGNESDAREVVERRVQPLAVRREARGAIVEAPAKARRINGARVAYRPRTNRRGVAYGAPENTPDAYMAVWKAIEKRKGKLVTALELETLSGKVKKTVESAIWFLRTNGAIESVSINRDEQ